MLKITISKTPTIRLFDRMPMPRGRVRSLVINRTYLNRLQAGPFQRRVSKIK